MATRLQWAFVMYAVLAAAVDLIHAAIMVVWVVGLPLLFMRRHPRLRLAYALYAIGFVVISRLSMAFLHECFLTSLVRPLWARAGAVETHEWFTVRAARLVFGMSPSHRSVVILSEALIFVTACGVILSIWNTAKSRRPRPRACATIPLSAS